MLHGCHKTPAKIFLDSGKQTSMNILFVFQEKFRSLVAWKSVADTVLHGFSVFSYFQFLSHFIILICLQPGFNYFNYGGV